MGPEGQLRPASALQPRLGRPRLTPAVIAATPLRVVARDLWAWAGADLRQLPAGERRARLAGVAASAGLHPAAALPTGDWPEWRAALTGARDRGATGLRLRRDAPGLGEVWHWPAPAHSLCATLIHAEVGPGGGLVSLTLGLRDGADWVPVAKVAADLPAPERAALAGWVRQHTIARFGPVRQVPPEQVFDLAFDRADPSPRHKAGLVLRGARLTGWQRDAAPGGCATLAGLRAIALAGQENCP
jgi:DNA ligase-1